MKLIRDYIVYYQDFKTGMILYGMLKITSKIFLCIKERGQKGKSKGLIFFAAIIVKSKNSNFPFCKLDE